MVEATKANEEIFSKKTLRDHMWSMGVPKEARRIIYDSADAAVNISLKMHEADTELEAGMNISGDRVKRIDRIANDQMQGKLASKNRTFSILEFGSEELDEIMGIKFDGRQQRYSVVTDPLDGSSLIKVNLAVGTLVGIHDGKIMDGRSGRDKLIAAVYMLYGPLTTLMYTAGKGTHEFVLYPNGKFILANEYVKMKDRGDIYSPGGLRSKWSLEHSNFIGALEAQDYKLRYSGALVADVNQILKGGGGVFAYPGIRGTKGLENGKLRLLYEEQIIAMLVEQAGGEATDGLVKILDIIPKEPHQKSPFITGSKYEIDLARYYYKGQS